jgi:hypothetical protein
MTNTLHRSGDAESFHDDYIVFAIPSKNNKDPNALPKLHRFLEIALEFKPVNLGDARHGGALRSQKNLGPLAHWKRDMKPDFQAVIKGLTVPTTCAAVFDNLPAAEQFVKRIKEENLGMSVNVPLPSKAPSAAATTPASIATVLVTRSVLRARRKRFPTRRSRCSQPCAVMG